MPHQEKQGRQWILFFKEEDAQGLWNREIACLIYETHQLSVFGWTVNPITTKAIQWGGDELFEGMWNTNTSNLKDNLLPLEKQQFIDSYPNDKAWLHTAFKDILILILKEFCPNISIKQFRWNTGFADMCTDHKITAWKKEQKDLSSQTVPLYEDNSDADGNGNNDNDEGDRDSGGNKELVCFESWDDEQKAFSLKDQGHVPIIRAAWDANEEIGKPLCLVHQLKKYQMWLATCAIIDNDEEPEPLRAKKKRERGMEEVEEGETGSHRGNKSKAEQVSHNAGSNKAMKLKATPADVSDTEYAPRQDCSRRQSLSDEESSSSALSYSVTHDECRCICKSSDWNEQSFSSVTMNQHAESSLEQCP
ncbi:hypothetical protein GYMLUDRAFT_248528 [Collybiopsis luxurians FD-317 M1]|uniref:Uncharacterized protein n=1 Tax=Collybiopsis luxurians FD-317 M1 TaxID=944289 RepID=A0A0D0C096_9AGAR|nr:hypothetical protein GYMLUDRAFT_248528 [Collybiopsis luxurians FD-317 M1]